MRAFNLRRIAVALGGLCAITSAAGTAAVIDTHPASALTNCSVNDLSIDGEETAFLGLINQYRAQNGLGALTLSSNLNRAASWMVVDLANNNYFSHTDSLGRAPSTRSVDCGYPNGAGENLAAGTVRDTAQEAFDAWKASSGHNANMLTSYYQQIGIARFYSGSSTYGWYWATEFGTVDDGTSGSVGSGTPPPVVVTKAALTSPEQGITLGGSTATFAWSAGSGALEYFLYAGTTGVGSNNLYGASQGLSLGRSVSNLPTDGSTIYIRLWTRSAGGWAYNDYSFQAATASTPPPPVTSSKASLLSPAAGTIIPALKASFSWSAASGGLEYFLYVGTSQGSNNLYGQSQGAATSVTLGQLPASGTTWVRLWTRTASGWTFNDYSFAGIR
ncbi:MAG: CAP domain-containing protein [Tepidiformaceae bacterium]